MAEIIIFGIAFGATYFGVAAFRRWSLQAGLLDVPNHRSSHDSPTPRGGGLVIVLICLLLYSYITVFLTHNFRWAYLAAATLVALISWLDDLYSVPFVLRLFVHAVAAVILIYGLGFWREIYIPGFNLTFQVGSYGAVVAFVWVVWMVNAYNFMDGIDGLAGSQAILAGISWVLFAYVSGYESVYFYGGVLAFSSIGFLIHNWNPAKVFMGDVGSAFLGLTFATLPLMAGDEKPANTKFLLAVAVSFVWFFVFDTALTFVRRALRGQKVWAAHREHLYQKMIISGMSHGSVSLIYAVFTMLVAVSFLIGVQFGGNWEFLVLFSIVLLSSTLIFCNFGKAIDLSDGK